MIILLFVILAVILLFQYISVLQDLYEGWYCSYLDFVLDIIPFLKPIRCFYNFICQCCYNFINM